jgi:HlyD family secretion protein
VFVPAELTSAPDRGIRRWTVIGAVLVGGLVIGLGGWAAVASISGAVIASGQVMLEGNIKKIQHPTGGIIGEIKVREGQRVTEGELLIRLDPTVARASLAIVIKQLSQMAARQQRLESERDGAESFTFRNLDYLPASPDLEQALNGERTLFEARRNARVAQRGQLNERIAQLNQEIKGLEGQLAAKTREIELIGEELVGVLELAAKNLVTTARVVALQRDRARLEGERGVLIADIARAKGRIAETELQLLQLDHDFRTEVARDLRETETRVGELIERMVAADDQVRRIDIRSPYNGMVHQLAVHSLGAVVTSADPLLYIVPLDDKLTIEARVSPQNIDQLWLGQTSVVRFEAFNQRITPELKGKIVHIAPDVSREPQTQIPYYLVKVELPPEEVARLGDLKLVPGMPVAVFMETGARTALSYLLKPLGDQISRAMRER